MDLTRSVGPLEFTHITVATFTDRDKLIEVLERNNPGRRIRVPRIDFANNVAFLVATGPRSSTGYVLNIVRVREESDRVLVVVHERTPSLGEPVRARVTYPYRAVAIRSTKTPVYVKLQGRP